MLPSGHRGGLNFLSQTPNFRPQSGPGARHKKKLGLLEQNEVFFGKSLQELQEEKRFHCTLNAALFIFDM